MNVQNTTISVVIPCHNCALTIDDTLRSVMNQALMPYEVILIENGSTDSTLQILNNWQSENPKLIKLLNLENISSASAARNAGLKVVSGDYIAFLDADDIWHKQKLLIQLAAMIKAQTGISGHQYQSIKDSNFDKRNFSSLHKYKFISLTNMLYSNHIATPTIMIKKTFLQPFDERLKRFEDWKCWVEIMIKSQTKVLLIPLKLAAGGKPSLGFSGLSANLSLMHQDAILAIRLLKKDGVLSTRQATSAVMIEMVKYPIRVMRIWYLRQRIWFK